MQNSPGSNGFNWTETAAWLERIQIQEIARYEGNKVFLNIELDTEAFKWQLQRWTEDIKKLGIFT